MIGVVGVLFGFVGVLVGIWVGVLVVRVGVGSLYGITVGPGDGVLAGV